MYVFVNILCLHNYINHYILLCDLFTPIDVLKNSPFGIPVQKNTNKMRQFMFITFRTIHT